MLIRKTGDITRYSFSDRECLGRQCFAPGMFQHRSPMACGGSRNTGSPDSPCCLTRAYRGCPSGPVGERVEDCFQCRGEGDAPCSVCRGAKQITISGLPLVDATLTRQRKAEGWKLA